MTDLVLLTALLPGPAYGYALKRTAGLIFGQGTLHNNVVYPLLKKFVQAGWVEQASVPGQRGQQRKQYRITAAGRTHLLDELGRFGKRDAADDGAFLFRVAMFDLLPEAKRKEILAARQAHLAHRLHELNTLEKSAMPESFSRVVLERVQDLAKDELAWVTKLEKPTRSKQHANRPVHARI